MFKSIILAAATASATLLAPVALADDRKIVTEAPTADEFARMLFGAPPSKAQAEHIQTRGIKLSGAAATSQSMPISGTAVPTPKVEPPKSPTPAHRPSVDAPRPVSRPKEVPQTQKALSTTSVARPATPVAPMIVATPVNFALDSDSVPSNFMPYLVSLADAMKRPEARGKVLVISGHTDRQGSDLYNLELSNRRAKSVEDMLVRLGVPEASMISLGKGEQELITGQEFNHALNRRVEFRIAG